MISIGKIDCDLESAYKPQKASVPIKVLRRDVGMARRRIDAEFRNDARVNQVLRSSTKIERPVVTGDAAKVLDDVRNIRADNQIPQKLVIDSKRRGRSKHAHGSGRMAFHGQARRARQYHHPHPAATFARLYPIENTWQFMRGNWLSNRVFSSHDDILDQSAAWNKLVAQPWKIISIGHRHWAHRR